MEERETLLYALRTLIDCGAWGWHGGQSMHKCGGSRRYLVAGGVGMVAGPGYQIKDAITWGHVG